MKRKIFLIGVAIIGGIAFWVGRAKEKATESKPVRASDVGAVFPAPQIATRSATPRAQAGQSGTWSFPGYEYARLGPGVSRWVVPKGKTNHILQVVVEREMPMTSEEAIRCQEAYDEVSKMRQAAELKNAEVEVVSDRNHIIRIKAYAEGVEFEASLKEGFRTILGADRASLLLKAAASSIANYNNYWGAEDQVIDVRYNPTTDLFEFSHGNAVPEVRVGKFTIKDGVQVSGSKLHPSDLSIYAYLEALLPSSAKGP